MSEASRTPGRFTIEMEPSPHIRKDGRCFFANDFAPEDHRAFLITAANSHDDLVKALREARTFVFTYSDPGTPMCSFHHKVYHSRGHKSFEDLYRLDLAKLAAEFAAKTPDEKLKAVLKESS